MTETSSGTITKERNAVAIGDGLHKFVPTAELAIAIKVTNEQLIEEERSLQKIETAVESKYRGIRGYWRLFEISLVIVMLSLYLYLDQFDIHKGQQEKQKKERLEKAMRLTRAAVYGEKLW